MARPTLNASVRTTKGKGAARKIRAQGLIPGVVYGKGKESAKLTIVPKDLLAILNSDRGRYQTIDLKVEGEAAPRLTLIKEFLVHPFKRTLKHVDFWQVEPDQQIVVKVPLKRLGVAPIEKIGGTVTFTHKLLKIRCTPSTMPAAIEYDLSDLPEEARLKPPRISELPMPSSDITAIYKSDFSFLRVRLRAVEEEEEEEGEEGEEGEEEAAETTEEKQG